MVVNDNVEVEWLILADAAQVVGGKLFVLGGGWDTLNVSQEFPVTRHCGLAVSFSVPWNQTNTQHGMEVEIQNEDGKELARIQGQFEVGRAPGIPVGTRQRTQIAADLGLTFEKPGNYVILAKVNGLEAKRLQFRVTGGKALNLPSMGKPS